MMAISEDEIDWALRLWNSLIVGEESNPVESGGTWYLDGVGVYVRTALQELTLTEIHCDRPKIDAERSLFDEHDYIVALAREIGWEIKAEVRKAHAFSGEFTIPIDRIGDVAVCANKCGTIARIEPLDIGVIYFKLEEGRCPVCGEIGFDDDWHDLHVVIDDRGANLRLQKENEEEE